MCGIAGILDTSATTAADFLACRASAMGTAIAHRGPDDADVWCDAGAGIALAHRRLAVVDLSAAGHQPMRSHDERFVIAYNGEIYNTAELRRALAQTPGFSGWRGHSDTEVLLEAVAAWGVKPALQRLVGMFAFALWDRREKRLMLARDRIGEKPLYYAQFGGMLLFGSELKALRAHPAFRSEVDRDVLALYLRHAYVPAPLTIFRGVSKVTPGCYVEFSPGRIGAEEVVYWSARTVAEAGVAAPLQAAEAELVEQLDQLLRQAVSGQMQADVPLGAFLSGGIDSSTVAALMQAQSSRPVNTFTIGSREPGYNEAEHAKAVAQHLGTNHTELYVTPEEARAVIPRLPQIYCEPFADSSQIPTFLVAQLTRRHVTVALSGDAGDELFAGYNRYVFAQRLWQRLSLAPSPLRRLSAAALQSISPARWDRLLASARPVLPRRLRVATPGDKVHKLAGVLGLDTLDDVYRRLVSQWQDPVAAVPGAVEPPTALTSAKELIGLRSPVERMTYLDLVTYLPDDILVKVDRAAMAVSLETRVPLLDHRVIEFAWRVPMRYKVRDGRGKHLLRAVLERYVPRSLFDRPKMGFGIPLDAWLRVELRDWAESLLSPSALKSVGAFEDSVVRAVWARHLSGRENLAYMLWCVLMYQAWHQHWSDSAPIERAVRRG
jgi:asparagine synthase (glutamine-hydrolysing)